MNKCYTILVTNHAELGHRCTVWWNGMGHTERIAPRVSLVLVPASTGDLESSKTLSLFYMQINTVLSNLIDIPCVQELLYVKMRGTRYATSHKYRVHMHTWWNAVSQLLCTVHAHIHMFSSEFLTTKRVFYPKNQSRLCAWASGSCSA